VTRWAVFAGITAAVLFLLVALARASRRFVSLPTRGDVEWLDALPDGANHLDASAVRANGLHVVRDEHRGAAPGGEVEPGDRLRPGPADASAAPAAGPTGPPTSMSTGELLLNVGFSHGLFLVLLVGGAVYARVPADALGVSVSTRELLVGLGFGAALAVANTVAGAVSHRLGYAPSEALRELLAPDSTVGWAVLLVLLLPLVALFEELLFRGALIGGFATGFGLSPWGLAVVSSAAFALGHGAQGRAGVVVTGLLGFVLAAGFVLTGSLLVVVVAHYVVNAAEFVVYEGLGVELAWR
jgi:membrane protease YdiL (CAAX protease family)